MKNLEKANFLISSFGGHCVSPTNDWTTVSLNFAQSRNFKCKDSSSLLRFQNNRTIPSRSTRRASSISVFIIFICFFINSFRAPFTFDVRFKKTPAWKYGGDEVFVSSSVAETLEKVFARIMSGLFGLDVFPIPRSLRRLQDGGDGGQRPGHQKHCVPTH